MQPPILLGVLNCFYFSMKTEEDLGEFLFDISKTGIIHSGSICKAYSSYYEVVFICLPLSQHGILLNHIFHSFLDLKVILVIILTSVAFNVFKL